MQTTCHAYVSFDHLPSGSPRTAHLSRPNGAAAVSLWLMSHGDTPYSKQLQDVTTKLLFVAKGSFVALLCNLCRQCKNGSWISIGYVFFFSTQVVVNTFPKRKFKCQSGTDIQVAAGVAFTANRDLKLAAIPCGSSRLSSTNCWRGGYFKNLSTTS